MREQLRIKRCYQREGKVEKKTRKRAKKKKAQVVNLKKKKKTGNDTLAFISFQGADVYVQPNGFPFFFFSWRMYKMSKKHVSAFWKKSDRRKKKKKKEPD